MQLRAYDDINHTGMELHFLSLTFFRSSRRGGHAAVIIDDDTLLLLYWTRIVCNGMKQCYCPINLFLLVEAHNRTAFEVHIVIYGLFSVVKLTLNLDMVDVYGERRRQ